MLGRRLEKGLRGLLAAGLFRVGVGKLGLLVFVLGVARQVVTLGFQVRFFRDKIGEDVFGPVVDLFDKVVPLGINRIGVGEGGAGAQGGFHVLTLPQPIIGFFVLVKLVENGRRFRHVVKLVGMIFVMIAVAVRVVVQKVIAGLAAIQKHFNDFIAEVANGALGVRFGKVTVVFGLAHSGVPVCVVKLLKHTILSGEVKPELSVNDD